MLQGSWRGVGRRWRIWGDLQGLPTYAGSVFSDAVVPPEDAERFRNAVDRRARGEPLAYVTGIAGFRHLTLRSDRRALIPRPETEGLVELVLRKVTAGAVADVGTGSGCIALALAEEGTLRPRRRGRLLLPGRSRSRGRIAGPTGYRDRPDGGRLGERARERDHRRDRLESAVSYRGRVRKPRPVGAGVGAP